MGYRCKTDGGRPSLAGSWRVPYRDKMVKSSPLRWPEPKFAIGDRTDRALCIGIKHEFLRCDDAFQDFAAAAETMILKGDGRRIAYKAYAAYARFVHHLYEFYIACAARDFRNTGQLRADLAERFIFSQTQRILTNRREAIVNGTAPAWENQISFYPENVPTAFARDFRSMRNILNGHVSTERATLSLTTSTTTTTNSFFCCTLRPRTGGEGSKRSFRTWGKSRHSRSPCSDPRRGHDPATIRKNSAKNSGQSLQIEEVWSEWQDLNLRPPRPEHCVLASVL
jgi:hypothetical protein